MTWLSDTIVLHSSRSCAILVHSATDDPIQSLMSSVYRLLGRPRRFLPLIQPWRTAVHRLSALAVCPKKMQFPSLDVLQKSRFFSNFFQNGLVCSVLFPADPQHASIWRHFKGANPTVTYHYFLKFKNWRWYQFLWLGLKLWLGAATQPGFYFGVGSGGWDWRIFEVVFIIKVI